MARCAAHTRRVHRSRMARRCTAAKHASTAQAHGRRCYGESIAAQPSEFNLFQSFEEDFKPSTAPAVAAETI